MSDGDFLDGYREAMNLMRDELGLGRVRVKELKEELQNRPLLPCEGGARSRILKALEVSNVDDGIAKIETFAARVKELEEERDEARRALRWVWGNVKEWRMSPCPNDILTIYFRAARAFERALLGEEE